MRILFSLCTTPERLIRMLSYCSDKGLSVRCSGEVKPLMNQGLCKFFVDFEDSIEIPSPEEASCKSVQFYLANERPDIDLVRMILSEDGEICEAPGQADLIVCPDNSIAEYCSAYPRRLVIGETELRQQFNDVNASNQLLPVVDPFQTPPPRLPDHLRPCWALLRKRNLESIEEGLSLFSEIVASNPCDGDALLDQVSVENGVLRPGKRFELNDRDTHPYSYYALLGLLSRSPTGSRGAALRGGIEKLNGPLSYQYEEALDITALPELRDFSRLSEVNMNILRPSESSISPVFSERWKNLSQLRRLTLWSEEQVDLDCLDAPLLEDVTLRGSGFIAIEGLRHCTHLQRVDISGTEVKTLEPISSLGNTCRILDISRTSIPSLEPLSLFSEFKSLDLDGCTGLVSLSGLREARITSKSFSIYDTPLDDVVDMPLIESEEVYLHRLPVHSLKGLGRSQSIKKLYLSDLTSLEDIKEISLLCDLEQLTIHYCRSLTDYTVIGELPCVKSVEIRAGISSNIFLPEIWPASLTGLRLGNLHTDRIGALPPGYDGSLDLTSVQGITSLEDVSLCAKLSSLKITVSALHKFNDLSPLLQCENLWLNVDMEGESSLSSAIISKLSILSECRLRLVNYSDIDLVDIAQIPGLRAVDLDVEYVRPTKEQLMPVVGMHSLEFLQFPAGSLPELGGCTFNTPGKIAKLKLQLLTL